jgi:glycosyltransferase involved in cell wall biosynthesis
MEVKKILLLSTGDTNGAYEAIYRLAKILINDGHQVAMMVKQKTQSDTFVIKYESIEKGITKSFLAKIISKVYIKLISQAFNRKKGDFNPIYDFISIDESTTNISASQVINQIEFIPEYLFTGMTNDFINSTDLLNIQQLTKAQVYNITVDMNHFTGGCHFAWDCKGYINGCSTNCPAIISDFEKNLAKINFEKKLENAKKGNFKIIAGSGWTLKQAKVSKIYGSQKIILNLNSLIDTKLFNTKNKDISKRIFDLDDSKFYILMGCQNANSKRKGFEYLLEAFQILKKNLSETQKNDIEVLIVSRDITNSFNEIPFKKRHIEYIKDYRLLSLLYQASDVFVNSSIEDSGPLMVSEALACGTPVVGFDVGVVNNMVINDYNGYKAVLRDSHDLASGISKIFKLSNDDYYKYSSNAVKQVEEFSSFESASKQFKNLFNN